MKSNVSIPHILLLLVHHINKAKLMLLRCRDRLIDAMETLLMNRP